MTLQEARAAFLAGEFQQIADAIHTGTADPESSRALIVFNTSAEPISGFVVFRVDMAWRDEAILPPVLISQLLTGREARCGIRNLSHQSNRLLFELWFEVDLRPGWDTYIAAYVPESATASHFDRLFTVSDTSYLVAETLRHLGNLPPCWVLDSVCLPQSSHP